ncbi:two-component sensor histidine kinase [Streptomyces chrestomyceticus JCM 4735]|uniref:histidine kinase n=1 Tax=Streptomyces chrestomyceticus JCM 4735 TaxID=1306181 RepID=A0A7U9KUM4_9ACTN|nr:histidine kinase [Streptomyces chrestomyceticus]GCD34341.1 two-component sensor histidine kinase [Streptomyces chrestomyceticus JCM 4735]
MPLSFWTSWPSREALSRRASSRTRVWIGRAIRTVIMAGLLWSALADQAFRDTGTVLGLAAVALCGLLLWGFFRTTLEHRLWPALGLLALLEAGAFWFHTEGARVPAAVVWGACAVLSMARLPLAAAVPCMVVSLGAYATRSPDGWLSITATVTGLGLAGYVVRLDSEAQGNAQRLLAQERAARKAEAETAALAERGRIAREVHDVLAHSLSAQLVHLEAARLLIQRSGDLEADRQQILERVVAARGMAREGLDGTRQALSALRGEMAPVEDFLRHLTAAENARLEVTGERRELSPEAGLALRRVAQEALTNVRKHAPGARVTVRLAYTETEVELEVRNSAARGKLRDGGPGTLGDLGSSGSGYGLLGMRERAELLGGTLDSGPAEEGFVVRLRVPV